MSSSKPTIPGAILIFSCHKHMNTRMQQFGLDKPQYADWPVLYFIANPFLDSPAKLYHNLVILRCEDSYIHVGKKVALGIKFVYDNFNVQEGVLRCGDDLLFNEEQLLKFIQTPNKEDYIGYNPIVNPDLPVTVQLVNDTFMLDYYQNHKSELTDPMHGIHKTIEQIEAMSVRPNCMAAGGVVFYLSNKAANAVLAMFSQINYDVFTMYEGGCYPFIIEDCAVAFTMFLNRIPLTNKRLYTNSPELVTEDTIAVHTNSYK